MTDIFKEFKFPSYEEISKCNQSFLAKGLYKGYTLIIPVTESLCLRIQCVNNHSIHMGQNLIQFSWCCPHGPAIAVACFLNTECGYKKGCQFLIDTANDIIDCFKIFIANNADMVE